MNKLLITVLTAICAVAATARSYNFTAASLNVDGMPPSVKVGTITTITLNPDAKESAGAEAIAKGIASRAWDFIALSEDFNYHADIMNVLNSYYLSATWRGKITDVGLGDALSMLAGNKKFDTDGLGLLFQQDINVNDETFEQWNKTYGITSNGSDQLIKKGYRYYSIEVTPGMTVDVYIHHMDAETDAEDIAARESQITQLADRIIATHNKRPVIIMGDTNCRYTRDRLYELLFKRLESEQTADGKQRFEVHDPWVEFLWADEGGYDAPQLQVGQPSIMTDTYGSQKGEVVDKIIYINDAEADGVTLTANNWRSASDFTFSGQEGGEPLSDHFPVVVDFTITGPDTPVVTGTELFLRNKATGKFLNQGGAYGTQAIMADYGNRIVFEGIEDNTYYLRSTAGYIKQELYLDGSESERGTFEVRNTDDGVYVTIAVNGSYLTAPDAVGDAVTTSGTADDDHAMWQVLTQSDLLQELRNATEESPIDATFMMRGANFNRNDTDNKRGMEFHYRLSRHQNHRWSRGELEPVSL